MTASPRFDVSTARERLLADSRNGTLREVPPTERIRAAPAPPDARASNTLLELPRLVADAPQEPGELELLAAIAEGGMGVIRAAKQRSLLREVAVKTLRRERRDDASRRELLQEARLLGALEHPGVVPVHMLGRTEDGEPLLVMKRIEGRPWSAVLHAASPEDRASSEWLDAQLDTLQSVCRTVAFAHSRGIIHRDLKPENVMLGTYGEVYVVDWGIAASLREEHQGRFPLVRAQDGLAGTPAYMAPEQAGGEGAAQDERTDVYLLGATLHVVLTGEPPHRAETLLGTLQASLESAPASYPGHVADDLAAICRRAMAADPQARYQSAEELRVALGAVRRHRESRELSRDAYEQLLDLEEQAQSSSAEDTDPVQRSFEACRYGFEAALRLWPENPQAKTGLAAALELMAHRALDQEDVRTARHLLRSVEAPSERTLARLREVAAQVAARDDELEALRRLHRDASLAVGGRARAAFALVLALVWSLPPLSVSVAARVFGREPTIESLARPAYLMWGIIGIVLLAKGRALMQNAASRRILASLAVVALGLTVFVSVAILADVPLRTAVAYHMGMFLAILATLAVTLDLRLLGGCVPYLAAALLGAARPSIVLELAAGAHFLAFGYMGLLWTLADDALARDAEAAAPRPAPLRR